MQIEGIIIAIHCCYYTLIFYYREAVIISGNNRRKKFRDPNHGFGWFSGSHKFSQAAIAFSLSIPLLSLLDSLRWLSILSSSSKLIYISNMLSWKREGCE